MISEPNVLEKWITNTKDASLLRQCFTGLFPLDQSKEGIQAYNHVLLHPELYVLKPQREG